MDVLGIFKNALERYRTVVGLRPLIQSEITPEPKMAPEGFIRGQTRFIRTPEPSNMMRFSDVKSEKQFSSVIYPQGQPPKISPQEGTYRIPSENIIN